jgi:hypothetical protein
MPERKSAATIPATATATSHHGRETGATVTWYMFHASNADAAAIAVTASALRKRLKSSCFGSIISSSATSIRHETATQAAARFARPISGWHRSVDADPDPLPEAA